LRVFLRRWRGRQNNLFLERGRESQEGLLGTSPKELSLNYSFQWDYRERESDVQRDLIREKRKRLQLNTSFC
jgi:hypothetical protein